MCIRDRIVRIIKKPHEKNQWGENWHSDVSYNVKPTKAVILRSIKIPPVGGDTMFANMELAWETLDNNIKEKIKDKKAVHSSLGGAFFTDEYEGMEAIYRVFENLDPEKMKGTFVALPVVTLPAFWLGIRNNPVDMKNMARVFPGSSEGTLSERLAWTLLQSVLRHADLYIDLHSSGRNYRMLTLCGYSTQGRQAEIASRAAYAFGAPVVETVGIIGSGVVPGPGSGIGVCGVDTEGRIDPPSSPPPPITPMPSSIPTKAPTTTVEPNSHFQLEVIPMYATSKIQRMICSPN